MSQQTLFGKLWRSHVVIESEVDSEPSLIYIDRHLVYEVTSANIMQIILIEACVITLKY